MNCLFRQATDHCSDHTQPHGKHEMWWNGMMFYTLVNIIPVLLWKSRRNHSTGMQPLQGLTHREIPTKALRGIVIH